MTLGIKVGPDKQSFLDLSQTNAPFAEVWFNIARADEYTELFAELKRRHMQVGLHFWGALADGTWTNIAYPDGTVIEASMNLIRQTIDIAATNHFQYVNVHPGCAAKISIDIEKGATHVLSKPISWDLATKTFLSCARTLDHYARRQNVVMTFETVPIRCLDEWYTGLSRNDSVHVQNIYELPLESVVTASESGLWVANDFGHTAANVITENFREVWKYLKKITSQLAPKTRLIHLNFVTPPFNGTDFHDYLDNPLMETDQAVPNKKQMIELLRLFTGRDDVWILVEPNGRHAENYFLAQKIVEESLQN